MKMLLCCLLALSLSFGCSKKAVQSGSGNANYLALGDSYTIGEAVNPAESFPFQLASFLSKQGIAVEPKIIARTGWTTNELISAIKAENISKKFDLVTLLIGVNNQYRGYSKEVYRKEFVELLNTAVTFAGGNKTRVFVISIPDWGATPFATGQDRAKIAAEIDQFNAINKEEATKAGVSYTDITPQSRTALSDVSLVASDGLHPSGKMYLYWAEQLLPKVAAELK
ncbi:MAG: hydrolase family protein [Sphingobacteriaceae bacterium]|jgi:lysophospholipase L1-like esterase|nr:hydrolase family protein [Sphingobacteriaceae bacterium]